MGSAQHNVLISSAGRRGELVHIFRESLALAGFDGGVYTIDRSPLTAAGWLSDGLDLVPEIADPGFIDAVIDVCRRRRIRHIIPTIDPELGLYADSVERFRSIGVEVWVSQPEAVAIAQDKRATNRWLRGRRIPTVNQDDLSSALTNLGLSFPVIAKPAKGSSSVGLVYIRERAELIALDAELDYVVEEIAPGLEYTVDVLVDDGGRAVASVPRRRIETRAGEVSKGVTVESPFIQSTAEQVVASLPGARGILNVQLFYDAPTESLQVIEINARVGGGYPLAWAAGAQFPVWLMQGLAGQTPNARLNWRPGTLMLRYDAAVTVQVDPGAFH